MSPALYRVPAVHRAFYRLHWDDAEAVHRRVMRLFPVDLHRDETGGARVAANILFRIELQAANPYVLVQSDVEPSDASLPRRQLDDFLAIVESGRRLRFRTDVNAVRMKSRTRRLEPVALSEVPSWLGGTRLGEGLEDVEVAVPGEFHVRRGKNKTPVRVIRLDGRAVVRDADAVKRVIRQGIGRARSYGCGLVSIAPAP